jgi:small conductance mechanosensitive channel
MVASGPVRCLLRVDGRLFQEGAMREVLDPTTVTGALVYAAMFLVAAILVARAIGISVKRFLSHTDHAAVDRTGIEFLTQLGQVLTYLCALVLYAHLIPVLRQLGTALLAGVSVASVVIGLAAQNTLSNVIAGFAILLYRPIRIGDRVQVAGPSGPLAGTIESLSLGYTIVRADDRRKIIVPNSTMASQVTVNLDDVASS